MVDVASPLAAGVSEVEAGSEEVAGSTAGMYLTKGARAKRPFSGV